jgi:hypothetical protein
MQRGVEEVARPSEGRKPSTVAPAFLFVLNLYSVDIPQASDFQVLMKLSATPSSFSSLFRGQKRFLIRPSPPLGTIVLGMTEKA